MQKLRYERVTSSKPSLLQIQEPESSAPARTPKVLGLSKAVPYLLTYPAHWSALHLLLLHKHQARKGFDPQELRAGEHLLVSSSCFYQFQGL